MSYRFLALMLVMLLPADVLLAQPVEPKPNDFALRIPLRTSGDNGVVQFTLPASVYQASTMPDLADLRLFGEDGKSLNFHLYRTAVDADAPMSSPGCMQHELQCTGEFVACCSRGQPHMVTLDAHPDPGRPPARFSDTLQSAALGPARCRAQMPSFSARGSPKGERASVEPRREIGDVDGALCWAQDQLFELHGTVLIVVLGQRRPAGLLEHLDTVHGGVIERCRPRASPGPTCRLDTDSGSGARHRQA